MADPKQVRAMLEKIADWARNNPGTSGIPESLKDGGPGDSDCVSAWMASIAYAAGQKCRLVCVEDPAGHGGAIYVEVFHGGFPAAPKVMEMPAQVRGGFHPDYPNFQWLAVLPHHGWIKEGAEILSWKRIAELEL